MPILFVGQLTAQNPSDYHENAQCYPVLTKLGPPHWWTLSRKPRECLPLFDQKPYPLHPPGHPPPASYPPSSSYLFCSSLMSTIHEGFFYMALITGWVKKWKEPCHSSDESTSPGDDGSKPQLIDILNGAFAWGLMLEFVCASVASEGGLVLTEHM